MKLSIFLPPLEHIQTLCGLWLGISFGVKQLRDCPELSLLRIQLGWFWWTDQRKVPKLHHAVPKYCLICSAPFLDSLSLFCSLFYGFFVGCFNIFQWCCLSELKQAFVTNDAYKETIIHRGIDAVKYLEYHVHGHF